MGLKVISCQVENLYDDRAYSNFFSLAPQDLKLFFPSSLTASLVVSAGLAALLLPS